MLSRLPKSKELQAREGGVEHVVSCYPVQYLGTELPSLCGWGWDVPPYTNSPRETF